MACQAGCLWLLLQEGAAAAQDMQRDEGAGQCRVLVMSTAMATAIGGLMDGSMHMVVSSSSAGMQACHGQQCDAPLVFQLPLGPDAPLLLALWLLACDRRRQRRPRAGGAHGRASICCMPWLGSRRYAQRLSVPPSPCPSPGAYLGLRPA
jgi:hypothetical protein